MQKEGQKKTKSKVKKWRKPRHTFGTALVRSFVAPYAKLKYGITVEKFKDQGKRPYLIVINHQTAFDQFFVGMAFKGPVYCIASEDLFSKGFVSKIIKFLVAPIPIKKQTTDLRAVMDCARIAKEGGTIALAPEGNRTYCGRTLEFKKSIVKLARLTKLPIAIFKIEGGYGVQPRWAHKLRKGKMHAYVKGVLETEVYSKMTDDELYEYLKAELYQDESKDTGLFYSKRTAEYLERVVYVCPDCGLTTFTSKGQLISCNKCGKTIRYNENKSLTGVNAEFPFKFIGEWYDYQNKFVNDLDLSKFGDKPLYIDEAQFSKVVLYKNKRVLDKKAKIELYANKIVITGKKVSFTFDFDKTEYITVLGKNKLNIYFDKEVYQIKGGVRFNALRHLNIFYKCKNEMEGGDQNGFLGI